MSIEETYGFGILQEGQAVAVAKNVKVRPNEFDCPISYGAFLLTPGLSLFSVYLPLLHSVAGLRPPLSGFGAGSRLSGGLAGR